MLTLNKMFVILIHGRKKQAIKGKSSLETGEKYGKNKTKIFKRTHQTHLNQTPHGAPKANAVKQLNL